MPYFMTTKAERLKAALERKTMTPSELSRATKIPLSSITAWRAGRRNPPLEKCLIMAPALNVDANWLFDGHIKKEVPLLTNANASEPVALPPPKKIKNQLPVYGAPIDGDHGRIDLTIGIVEHVVAPPSLEEVDDAYAVYVVGSTMEPRYFAGEMVFIHPRKPIRRGDFVFIQVIRDDGGTDGYIKRLVSLSDQAVTAEQFRPEMTMEFPRDRIKSVHRIVLAGEG